MPPVVPGPLVVELELLLVLELLVLELLVLVVVVPLLLEDDVVVDGVYLYPSTDKSDATCGLLAVPHHVHKS